jgi:hypothetical protein
VLNCISQTKDHTVENVSKSGAQQLNVIGEPIPPRKEWRILEIKHAPNLLQENTNKQE